MTWTNTALAESKLAVLEARATGLWARFRNALIDAENQNGVPARDGREIEKAAKDWGAAAVAAERARIRRELKVEIFAVFEKLVAQAAPGDLHLIEGSILAALDRICPDERKEG